MNTQSANTKWPGQVVLSCLALAVAGCASTNSDREHFTNHSNAHDTAARMHNTTTQLSIRLEPAVDGSDHTATLLFHNLTQHDLKIPLMDTGGSELFFDFVFVGNQGGLEVVDDGGGWNDPVVKPVKLVSLPSKQEHRLDIDIPVIELDKAQTWSVMVIYRDHTYGHSPTYPEYSTPTASWQGAAPSNLVPIPFPK